MSPSRGIEPTATHPSATTSPPPSNELENTANIRSSTALASLKRNIHYLVSPSSPTSPQPARLRTRALLRSLHYISVFIFWRIIRYAKYAAVGSIVAAVGATTIGSFATGVGWIIAPTGVVGCVGMGLVWWVAKWGFRKTGVGKKLERRAVEAEEQEQRQSGKEGVRTVGEWRDVTGPKAVPW